MLLQIQISFQIEIFVSSLLGLQIPTCAKKNQAKEIAREDHTSCHIFTTLPSTAALVSCIAVNVPDHSNRRL